MKPNDYVVNSRQPAWGVGKVLEDRGEGKLRVHFEYVGEKVMLAAVLAQVETPLNFVIHVSSNRKSVKKGGAASPRPSAPRKPAAGFRSPADLVQNFLDAYPRGFSDAGYLTSEREKWEKASKFLRDRLTKEGLSTFIATGHYRELCIEALRVMDETSLVSASEKMALKDGIQRDKTGREAFARTLFDLLYDKGELEVRFEAFVEALSELDALSWTTATYFLFLFSAHKYPFVNPQLIPAAARAYAFDISWTQRPNWQTYARVMAFIGHAASALATQGQLLPRDWLDVQGFFWKAAGGKGA